MSLKEKNSLAPKWIGLLWYSFKKEVCKCPSFPLFVPFLSCTIIIVSWVRSHHGLDACCEVYIRESALTQLLDLNENAKSVEFNNEKICTKDWYM